MAKMDKGFVHHWWRRTQLLNYWVVFAVFMISTVVAVFALRQNNLTMIKLRDAVYIADKNNTDIEAPLKGLRQHIYAHMNSDPSSGSNAIKPPIQLKYQYERLLASEKAGKASANAQVYTDAQKYCESGNTAFSGRSRVPCIQEYVAKNGLKEVPIEDALYKYDFVSPRLSFDLAGISLIISVLSLALFITLLTIDRLARWELKRHY